jgi:serine protease Do
MPAVADALQLIVGSKRNKRDRILSKICEDMQRSNHFTRAGRFRVAVSCFVLLIAIALAAHSSIIYPTGSIQLAQRGVRLPDFVALANQVAPSLVHISTLYAQSAQPAANSLDRHNGPAPDSRAPGGLGSGIIINSDGHILTNYHVVDGADKIVVKLADRRAFDATVVGRDARSDLAVLKIAPRQALQPARMGDSSRLETGEWVFAMGSPFGLDRTVTAGIVSAKARRIPASVYYDYIQTDISINPGNSGGPLLNLRGRVVGINAAMLSRNGFSVGINFAIPINLVKDLLPELLARGRVTRGWLGISTQIMTPAVARRLKSDQSAGALVVAVDANGPAAGAGIHPGDIVACYDGRSIVDAIDLPALVAKTAVGRQVTLAISRNRILYQTILRIGELKEPQQVMAHAADEPKIGDGNTTELGANFAIVDARAGNSEQKRGTQHRFFIEEAGVQKPRNRSPSQNDDISF